ncbi:MAG: DUF4252 domain-containing protein [Chitinophagales bacterium]|nr:DUF4252 domain-containing protein [Chitinophagales bacterium]
MKNVLLLALSLFPATIFAQSSVQSFFDKYAGKDGFTTVKISPSLFGLIASADIEDENLTMIKDITGVNVLIYDGKGGKSDNLLDNLYGEARSLINSGYEELMAVKEEGTDLKILAKSAGHGIISDLLIMGKDEGEFIYVNVLGKIDLKKIKSLGQSIDIKGMEHLKDLDDGDKK